MANVTILSTSRLHRKLSCPLTCARSYKPIVVKIESNPDVRWMFQFVFQASVCLAMKQQVCMHVAGMQRNGVTRLSVAWLVV